MTDKHLSTHKRKPLDFFGGVLALLFAALWSGNPVALKAGLEDSPPLRLGWMRFILGGLVVLVWVITKKESLIPSRSEIPGLLGLGILFSVQLALLNIGLERTSAGHASVIIVTFPIWVSVFAHFIVPNDRLNIRRAAGIVFAYSGVAILFVPSIIRAEGSFITGDILLLCSAVLIGMRQVYISQIAQVSSQSKVLMAQSIGGTVTFIIASFILENDPWVFTARLAFSLVYQGIIIAGFGFMGSIWLLKNYLPSRISFFTLVQPAIGVLLAWAILGEGIGLELYASLPPIIIGSYLLQRSK